MIEEVARVYGYFKLPSVIPPVTGTHPYSQAKDMFYWEARVRNALKYWGFTEIYSYPMVAESMLEVATSEAVTIKNPLTEDHTYMRTTLIPSLLEAVRENKNRNELRLYELANVYLKRDRKLPDEKLKLSAVIKRPDASFQHVKGLVEALLSDLGIKNLEFKPTKGGGVGADVYIEKEMIGEIEQLEKDLIDFEFDFETILNHATLAKIYTPPSKFPEAQEDLRFEIDEEVAYDKIVKTIKEQSELVKHVELLDVYKNKKTFRIIYQAKNRNLTNEDLTELREKITSSLKSKFKAEKA